MLLRPRPGVRGPAWELLLPFLALAASLPLWNFQSPVLAASALLEKVRNNRELGLSYCARFNQLNAEGVSATSKRSVDEVAAKQGLSYVDAEVMVTYVIGLYCPDTR